MRRRGRYIQIDQGLTAVEGHDGLPTLTIRRRGKIMKVYRGSSLEFHKHLTAEDERYLLSLVKDCQSV